MIKKNRRISNNTAVAQFDTIFKFRIIPLFPSPADKIPPAHEPKERLRERLIHNSLRSNGVTRWSVRVRYIKPYHVHHSTATDSRWRSHSEIVNLKQNPHSVTHSYPLPIGEAQHLSRKEEHTITPFDVTHVVCHTFIGAFHNQFSHVRSP